MSQSQNSNLPVSIEFLPGERPAVRSLELAQHFGLKHKNVLRDIEALRAKLPKAFTGLNFEPSTYEDPTGRTLPCYLLTRDAFSLLVMGWNSARAIEWKLKYIQAFNALEAAALANARTDALAEGARTALAMPREKLARIGEVARYYGLGLTCREIAKLLDINKYTAWKDLRLARRLGMAEASPTPARRRDGHGTRA